MLAGCSLAPKLEQPQVEVPAQFKQLSPEERGRWKTAQPAEAQPRGEWWRAFDDPALDALEAEALAGNQSLKALAARVSQARALVGVARSERAPRVDAGFGPSRIKPPQAPAATAWRGLVSVSYEVDLFGRISDGIAAARGDFEALQAAYYSIQLALQADVAQTYFALREADEELALRLAGGLPLIRWLAGLFCALALANLALALWRVVAADPDGAARLAGTAALLVVMTLGYRRLFAHYSDSDGADEEGESFNARTASSSLAKMGIHSPISVNSKISRTKPVGAMIHIFPPIR